MKKNLLNLSFIAFYLLLSSLLFAQEAIIRGKIIDRKNNESLPGVNIVDENKHGTTTDMDGKYHLSVSPGKHTIKFTYIGYKEQTKDIDVKAGEKLIVDIMLMQAHKQLQMLVISSSQYEKNISQETVSMDVIKPELIKNTNATELSEVVYKTPGVNIQDGQISIRGGSAFSYGIGSRVNVMVDGLSSASGDLGDAKWKFIPIEDAEQVEVIK